MKRFIVFTFAATALVAGAVPARAQDQGFSVNFGYFWPKGSESRTSGDVRPPFLVRWTALRRYWRLIQSSTSLRT